METNITIRIEHMELNDQLRDGLRELLTTETLSDPRHIQYQLAWSTLMLASGGAIVTVEHTPGWLAGWNIPGCQPDDEPQLLENYDDALEYLADELMRAREQAMDQAMEKEGGGDASDTELMQLYREAEAQVRRRIGTEPDQQTPFWLAVRNYTWWIAREHR